MTGEYLNAGEVGLEHRYFASVYSRRRSIERGATRTGRILCEWKSAGSCSLSTAPTRESREKSTGDVFVPLALPVGEWMDVQRGERRKENPLISPFLGYSRRRSSAAAGPHAPQQVSQG